MKRIFLTLVLFAAVLIGAAQIVPVQAKIFRINYGAQSFSINLNSDSILMSSTEPVWFNTKFGSDTLLFGDGTYMTTAPTNGGLDTGYVKTTGDTLYGAYLFKSNTAATMSFYQALGWWTGSDGIETNTIMAGNYFSVQRLGGGGNINSYLFRDYLRFSDQNLGLDIYYRADSIQTGSNFVFDMPTAEFTGDIYISERINGLYYQSDSTNLINDASIVLTNGISGWGEVYAFNAGAIDEWAEFIISSDGAVYLKSNSTDVVNTDTANKLCIFDNGSGVTIRNRLGGTRIIKYIIHH